MSKVTIKWDYSAMYEVKELSELEFKVIHDGKTHLVRKLLNSIRGETIEDIDRVGSIESLINQTLVQLVDLKLITEIGQKK